MSQRLIWILWPGFLMAIPAVGVVFSFVDPADVHGLGIESRMAAYSAGFVFFWAIGCAASALTCLLQRSPFEVNRCPLTPTERPEGCPKRSGGTC
jgi:hypothetical protein